MIPGKASIILILNDLEYLKWSWKLSPRIVSPDEFESISCEKYALNVLYERARKNERAQHDSRCSAWYQILDRDLDSWIKIRIED